MPNSQLKVKGILVIAEKIRKNAVGFNKRMHMYVLTYTMLTSTMSNRLKIPILTFHLL